MATLPPNPSMETLFNPVRCFATQGTAIVSPAGTQTDDLFKASAVWSIQPVAEGTWTPSGPIVTTASDGVLQVKPPWKGLFYVRVTVTGTQPWTLTALEGSGSTWTSLESRSVPAGTQSSTFLWFRKDDTTSLRLRYTTSQLLASTTLSKGSLDVMGVRGWL